MLSGGAVLFIVVYSFTRRIKQASRAVRKKEGELFRGAGSAFVDPRSQGFFQEDYEQERFNKVSECQTALRARSLKAKLAPIVQVVVAVGTSLVLWYGARLVLAGEMTAGSLLVFLLYLGKMYKPMRELSKMTDTLAKTAVGYERIQEVLETERDIRNLRGARPAATFQGAIGFRHVNFGYSDDNPILQDVDFKIEPGQLAAFVGPTGAGKTTIASSCALL